MDAIIIGAGFSGLYALYSLRDRLGLRVRCFDGADGVGGTWYWNRYPGARCDTESFAYCYSFSPELLQEWEWSDRYPTQPEILRYLDHVTDRFDLRRDLQLSTRIAKAEFCQKTNRWKIETEEGDRFSAKYLISGIGLFTTGYIPSIEGLSSFEGECYHTGAWPHQDVDFSGKRVGIIGTGSTGIQAIPVIAERAEHLTVFQRSPQYSVPARHGPLDQNELSLIKADYCGFWDRARNSVLAFGFEESATPAMSVSEHERAATYETIWKRGGGLRFMFGAFSDVATDREANETAASFVRSKIRSIVRDPVVADILTPKDLYASRPVCDTGYYETFNRDNVSLVDVRRVPIRAITPKGLRTDDLHFPLDILVFATGFDAVTGVYSRIDIRGKDGVALKDKWAAGPKSYLGVAAAGFPNMFMIVGPCSPFTNLVPAIEAQVEWISDMIARMEARGVECVEALPDAEDAWVERCREIGNQTLFPQVGTWIFGANIPGKPRTVMFYLGGLANYRSDCQSVVEDGYRGFREYA